MSHPRFSKSISENGFYAGLSICLLPTEFLLNVIEHVDEQDLARLRLVNHNFRRTTTRKFGECRFIHLIVMHDARSVRNLLEIANHSTWSIYVRVVTLSGEMLREYTPTTTIAQTCGRTSKPHCSNCRTT